MTGNRAPCWAPHLHENPAASPVSSPGKTHLEFVPFSPRPRSLCHPSRCPLVPGQPEEHTYSLAGTYPFAEKPQNWPSELEWVAIPYSWWPSWPRDWTLVSCTVGRCFTIWATREVILKCKSEPKINEIGISKAQGSKGDGESEGLRRPRGWWAAQGAWQLSCPEGLWCPGTWAVSTDPLLGVLMLGITCHRTVSVPLTTVSLPG